MDQQTAQGILDRVRSKQADATTAAFADTVHGMENARVRSDAGNDIKNMILLSLGAGVAGRGAVGLINLFRQKPPPTRSGPAMLPLPYPVEPEEMPDKVKVANLGGFMAGSGASSKWGVPYYTPAMALLGIASLGVGWKGMDAVLDARRRRGTEEEMNKARDEFQDALLSQYNAPIKNHALPAKAASASTMTEVGPTLDRVFDKFGECLDAVEKRGIDWSNAFGAGVGTYGALAGLTALLTGSLVYDKTNKRSRRALLDKALKRRQQRRFLQQPTEIYAVPEPVTKIQPPNPQAQMRLISQAPDVPA